MFIIISISNPIVKKIAEIVQNAGIEVVFLDPCFWQLNNARDNNSFHISPPLSVQISNADAVFVGNIAGTNIHAPEQEKIELREQIFSTIQEAKVQHLVTLNYLNPVIAALIGCESDLYHGEDLNIVAEISALHTTKSPNYMQDTQEFCMCMLTMYRPVMQQNFRIYQEILEDISLIIARELLYRGTHFNRRRLDFENGNSYTQSLHCKVSRRIDRYNYRWRAIDSHFYDSGT